MDLTWTENRPENNRIYFPLSYFQVPIIEKIFGVTNSIKKNYDFTIFPNQRKNSYLQDYSNEVHDHQNLNGKNYFYSKFGFSKAMLVTVSNTKNKTFRYTYRLFRLFVPEFYHENKNIILRDLVYVGEKQKIDERIFSESYNLLGRKLYEFQTSPRKTAFFVIKN